MNNLGIFEKKGKILVNSRTVSEKFKKRHDNIVTAIEGLVDDSKGYPFQKETPVFIKQKYIHPQNGQEYTEYFLNKRAFILLMMRLKGEVAFDIQNKFIDRFEQMEAALSERQTTDWLNTREKGKIIRREETDAIQALIPYAIEQGSKSPEKYYVLYSKLVNKAVGLKSGQRGNASFKELMTVAMLEDMIQNTIREEMEKGVYYKTIYQICKDKVNRFVELTYLKIS